ncbi:MULTISPECIES: IS66 family insertion sequence element accessory protein TnpB [unclassified Paraburkholderia]|uniref:IS66 family insertion sequence element accessory protein TnpB n=1 Tax=unclassified Paraburkholderia TaxID=2615204 RepID=UPI0038B95BBF
MIGLPAGIRIGIAAGVTDMRCGFQGVAAKVQTALEESPMGGNVFIFRGRHLHLCNKLSRNSLRGHASTSVSSIRSLCGSFGTMWNVVRERIRGVGAWPLRCWRSAQYIVSGETEQKAAREQTGTNTPYYHWSVHWCVVTFRVSQGFKARIKAHGKQPRRDLRCLVVMRKCAVLPSPATLNELSPPPGVSSLWCADVLASYRPSHGLTC